MTLFVEGEQSGMDEVILKMSVTDTGMGIRQDDMKYLFDSFKRVNEGNTKGIEGTGLGLSICSQLVKLMGGNIAVDSIYQKGSTFTVTIPQKIVNADPLGTLDYNSSQGRNHQTYKKTFEAPAAKVLVVDDNDMNLLVVKKLLRETKVQLSLAHSGRECLKMTAKTAYDVIFSRHLKISEIRKTDFAGILRLLHSRQMRCRVRRKNTARWDFQIIWQNRLTECCWKLCFCATCRKNGLITSLTGKS